MAVSAEHMGDGLRLGPERQEVDPVTGEWVAVQDVLWDTPRSGSRAVAVRARDPGHGFVYLGCEALWFLRLYCRNSMTACMLLIEAVRRHKLGMGPLALTYATHDTLGLSRKEVRTALLILEDVEATLGWVRVIRSNKKAVQIGGTDVGVENVWHNGGKGRAG